MGGAGPNSVSKRKEALVLTKHLRKKFSVSRFLKPALFCPLFILVTAFLIGQDQPSGESIEESIFQSSQNLHQWGAINSFHGLPSEKVNAISQSRDGFLWFGTDNGLARFDGRRVQTNLYSDLSSVRILDLETDSTGTVWIGSEKGGYVYRNGVFEKIKETANHSIISIFVDEDDDEIILASAEGSVFRCLPNQNAPPAAIRILESELPIRSVSGSASDLLIGTFNDGLQKIEGSDSKPILTRPRPFFVNVVKRGPDGNIWLGTRSIPGNSGLFLSEKLPDLVLVGENLGTVNTISFNGQQQIWVGTENRGAYLFEGTAFRKRFTFENTSGGLRSNRVLATFIDRERVVWFGTDKGVSRFDSRSPRNESISDNVQSNFVRTLFEASDGTQLAGTNRGLFAFNPATSSWNAVGGFDRDIVHSISDLGTGSLLIGTQTGFYMLETEGVTARKRSLLSTDTTRSIAQFKGKIYYAAFDKGMKTIEGNGERLLFKSQIISLYSEDNKTLWLGTVNQGVRRYDGAQISSTPELAGIGGDVVRSIDGNSKDGIWFATNTGLWMLKNGKLESLIEGVEARAVLVRRNSDGDLRVYCATANGLFNIAFDDHFGWITSRLDVEQGLSSQNVFAVLRTGDDSILIGTNRGIVRFQPSDTPPILVPNRIVSQRVHQLSELRSGINLAYPQNALSIDVSAISSRTYPEQFQYSFLVFNDKNELISKRFGNDSQFLMENLIPDTYRVEVRAFDRNLTASAPLTFQLNVDDAPFPLVAAILGVLLVIALTALIWAIFSQQKIFRTSKELALANNELNAARLDLANEAERERHRISRDLHDQTLADLRHLLLMADDVSTDKAPEFRSEIEGVSEEIRRICEDLSPSVLENIGFAAALEWALRNSVEQVSAEKKIRSSFKGGENLEENLDLSRAEQIQIYRIAQEVLSNIVRHSDATAINMLVENSPDSVFSMRIEDNGKVFDPEQVQKGRGLSNIRARVELVKAEFEWRRSEKKGMVFILRK